MRPRRFRLLNGLVLLALFVGLAAIGLQRWSQSESSTSNDELSTQEGQALREWLIGHGVTVVAIGTPEAKR